MANLIYLNKYTYKAGKFSKDRGIGKMSLFFLFDRGVWIFGIQAYYQTNEG